METITWVGINHYVEESELTDFYSNLKEGDIVTLIPEPDNYWDDKAVAVFYKFLMRGHISRHETSIVHLMSKNNIDLVGRIMDDIDTELHQVKLDIDAVNFQKSGETDYPQLEESALGIDMSPHIMYEEYSYAQIKERMENLQKTIQTNDIESKIVDVAVKEIIKTMEIYLSIWDHSISKLANTLPSAFDAMLTYLSGLSKDIKDQLKDTLKKVRRCTAHQSRCERTVDIFTKQMSSLDKIYSKEKGFYSVYEQQYEGKPDKMKKRIEAIEKWLNRLPSNKQGCFSQDFTSFVHNIYCYGYKTGDLYEIITHLLSLRRLAIKLYNLPYDITVEKLIVKGNMNVFGDVLSDNATKVMK